METKQRWLWSIGAGVVVLLIGAGSTVVQARLAARRGASPTARSGQTWRIPGGGGPGQPGPGRGSPGPGGPWGPGMMGPGGRPGRGARTGGDLLPQAPAAPGAERVQASISIGSGKLDPATLTVAQGKRLVLTVTNNDTVAHGFTIPGLGVRLQRLDPGASRVIELNTDRPGSYPYFTDTSAGRGRVRGDLTIAAAT